MTAAATIGFSAGVLQALAYFIYASQVLRAETRPNGMTWIMWTSGTFVFLVIEIHIGVPLSILILPSVCLVASLGVAAYACVKGVHLPSEPQDWAPLALDAALLAGYAIMVTAATPDGRSAGEIGLLFVGLAGATVVASFWPILRTTFLNPHNERPLAWFVWSAAYGLLMLAVMFEGMSWPFLVFPVVSLVLNLLIGIIALEPSDSFVRQGEGS